VYRSDMIEYYAESQSEQKHISDGSNRIRLVGVHCLVYWSLFGYACGRSLDEGGEGRPHSNLRASSEKVMHIHASR
jgi:hypothetical protein